ncbi:MAG TPA: alkaline phosphatase D family protein [Segeticoccus sp.]|uniref:alkaline phosphatase D family protein n=1 Tax=Segeticoccus sp. TaxID=2706531 RepID=UPI002D7FF7CD|nr:alkaline phosphatase D family protein [Segeticoccus sp.]HET8600834.1 alkaline phosphatase D family protein [Segeticoccus sp.]
MGELLVGPVLRHVSASDATVWVETSEPGVVEVLGHQEPTWTVSGHHYALVHVTDLPVGSTTAYDVRLGGELVWPVPEDPHPAPVIRTISPDAPIHLVFGSCRHATSGAMNDQRYGSDSLDAYARRLAGLPHEKWPTALLLVGDQVYADETSPKVREQIRRRRSVEEPPGEQVKDYEEYTWLYLESWTDPEVRWLLSTVPSSMIFDDHDVRDDWNTSAVWRREMQATSWWEERIIGGLSSYWVYQHLGNLSPEGLASDELYQKVRAHGSDAWPLLREFARDADREADGAKGAQWSYRRDLCRTRLLVVDSRCGRMLEADDRSMLSEREWSWVEAQVDGDYDHLLLGTSLPWLLPRALHDLESWDERLAGGTKGPTVARFGEWLRQRADLEHWSAFRGSFDRLAALLASVGRGERTAGGRPPATICVLSGDVHHAYVAQAHLGHSVKSPVYQLTCSPLHNYVPPLMKKAFEVTWSRVTERVTRLLLGTVSDVPPLRFHWDRLEGPYFGDQIATLTLDGRSAELVLEQGQRGPDGPVLGARFSRLPLA